MYKFYWPKIETYRFTKNIVDLIFDTAHVIGHENFFDRKLFQISLMLMTF